MPRIVKHVRKTPYKVEKDGVTVWICGCGLSTKLPFCSGVHNKIKEEPENEVFVYDLDLNRVKYSGPDMVGRFSED
jgi:CDGSH-type Zn-finger protein